MTRNTSTERMLGGWALAPLRGACRCGVGTFATGGIASLNHRLISDIPSGCDARAIRVQQPDLWVRLSFQRGEPFFGFTERMQRSNDSGH